MNLCALHSLYLRVGQRAQVSQLFKVQGSRCVVHVGVSLNFELHEWLWLRKQEVAQCRLRSNRPCQAFLTDKELFVVETSCSLHCSVDFSTWTRLWLDEKSWQFCWHWDRDQCGVILCPEEGQSILASTPVRVSARNKLVPKNLSAVLVSFVWQLDGLPVSSSGTIYPSPHAP